ncbi:MULTISPECIES: hypothetical protein, partial [unclassified Raoultella]|uniref:hypothetical protein n=1 Tax=unclassified Raoultella TaxID=2627600 RepID=UPI001D0F55F8
LPAGRCQNILRQTCLKKDNGHDGSHSSAAMVRIICSGFHFIQRLRYLPAVARIFCGKLA